MHASKLLIAIAALAPTASAGTYVVDAAGGGDFTDIAPAIAFASPGDVLLIEPGTYGAFTLDKRLVILGQGTAPKRVQSSTQIVRVENVHTGNCVVIADLEFGVEVSVESCSRPVVFDRVWSRTGFGVDAASDVRCYGSHFEGDFDAAWLHADVALALRASRIEVVESLVEGFHGADIYEWGTPGDGGDGMWADVGARVHCARSSVYGGNGGIDLAGLQPGGVAGGGIYFDTAAELVLYGTVTDSIAGGSDENGVAHSLGGGGPVRHSGVDLAPPIDAPQLQTVVPDDPSLYVLGIPKPGVTTTFRVAAAVGAIVELWLGRNPTIVDVPGLAEDVLVAPQRKFDLGQVGASGVVGFNFPTPGTFPKGFTFFAQAKVTVAAGDVRYTNSVPIVLR